jgi:hypothetical protein
MFVDQLHDVIGDMISNGDFEFALPEFSKCPADMSVFRSDAVANSFEPAMLDGLWYQHAFVDVQKAGVQKITGSNCQTMVNSHDDETGVVTIDFTDERRKPFFFATPPIKLKEDLTPYDDRKGFFEKKGGSLLKAGEIAQLTMPTVVVEVTDDLLTLYSCLDLFNAVEVSELVFASRSPTIDDATLQAMKDFAVKQGIEWEESDLNYA